MGTSTFIEGKHQHPGKSCFQSHGSPIALDKLGKRRFLVAGEPFTVQGQRGQQAILQRHISTLKVILKAVLHWQTVDEQFDCKNSAMARSLLMSCLIYFQIPGNAASGGEVNAVERMLQLQANMLSEDCWHKGQQSEKNGAVHPSLLHLHSGNSKSGCFR